MRFWLCFSLPQPVLVWAQPKTFDVSTIKPNAGNDYRFMFRVQPGGRLVGSGVTLKMLIYQAYDVQPFQVAGGPDWANTERWDIEAKAEGVDQLTPDQLRPMLRALIEERFQLKVRKETKEMPVYALTVAKNGPKLAPSSANSAVTQDRGFGPDPSRQTQQKGAQVQRATRGAMRMSPGQLDARDAKVEMLLRVLGQATGRPVIDKTGLTGEYDFKLTWTPDPSQGTAACRYSRATTWRRCSRAQSRWPVHFHSAAGATGAASGIAEGARGDAFH